jgi:general secretion pathway protein C
MNMHGFNHNLSMTKVKLNFKWRMLWPAWLAALTWSCAMASVVFWYLYFPHALPQVTGTVAPAQAVQGAVNTEGLRRAWGLQSNEPQLDSSSIRYQLFGVVASHSGQGSALIAIDGQPPQAYVLGQSLGDGLVLQGLGPREARLGKGAAQISLSLPEPDASL